MSQGREHDGPHGHLDSGQSSDPIDGEPPRSPPLPNQGLRKRTSILVGIAFLLFGLLMLFIAGDSAARIAQVQCSSSVLHADISSGAGYFVIVP